jgi:hypothetical protein
MKIFLYYLGSLIISFTKVWERLPQRYGTTPVIIMFAMWHSVNFAGIFRFSINSVDSLVNSLKLRLTPGSWGELQREGLTLDID